jgi:ABC-2 type transport system permease protein
VNTIYHTLSVTWKEIQLIAKDRGTLAVLFLLPLLLGTLIGGINLQLAGEEDGPAILLDVGLVNQDGGTFGAQVAQALQSIEELKVETFDRIEDAEGRVAEGEITAAVVIPADFTQKINTHTPTAVEVIVDPAQPEAASIVTGIMNQVVAEVTIWGEVQYGIRALLDESGLATAASAQELQALEAQNLGVIMTRLNEIRRNPAIAVVSEDLGGATVEGGITLFFAYMFPGFTVMFVFFIVGMSGSSLLNERESGALRRLLAAPISRGAIIAGKMLAYVALACLQVVALLGVASIFFDMPLGESPAGLVLLTLAVGLVATALGMLVAALSKTPKQADDVGTVLAFVLAGVGGAIPLAGTPIARAGGFMGGLAKLTPHAYAVEGYYSLMAENGTLAQILPELGIMAVMAVVFCLVAVSRFKFD